MNPKILLICKASIKEGLGHLIRTKTLADFWASTYPEWEITFQLITDLDLSHLLKDTAYHIQVTESLEIDDTESYDRVVLDMLSFTDSEFESVANIGKKITSISPIFNQMSKCDLLVTRTKYQTKDFGSKLKIEAGLQNTIIRSDCYKIDGLQFENNLRKSSINIAISMGGTDPNNNTLKVLKAIKDLEQPAVFWVLLGEGYEHNYEALTQSVNEDTTHEIILAKTNKNMWHILSNCSLAILTGGVTSYESAYAGLPAINYFQDPTKSYLVKELVELKLCVSICYDEKTLMKDLSHVLNNKNLLLDIHKNSKQSFNSNPLANVAKAIIN
ncbi:MAG: glycosyltransferase [Saprospiraceae bacterium]|nr:glycosyltransferase [Saprospiraceae bacterium]